MYLINTYARLIQLQKFNVEVYGEKFAINFLKGIYFYFYFAFFKVFLKNNKEKILRKKNLYSILWKFILCRNVQFVPLEIILLGNKIYS